MNTNLYQVIERRKLIDARGYFLKTMTGFEPDLPQQFGEIYVIKGDGGQARANHFHNLATEWFTLLEGRVRLNLRNIDTGEEATLLLNDQVPVTVRIHPRVAHSLLGEEQCDYILMAYTNMRYDPADTIAHPQVNVELCADSENWVKNDNQLKPRCGTFHT
jgi:dTDP-4-dehydrorhamnose 3,5-epimerase-like enzyme